MVEIEEINTNAPAEKRQRQLSWLFSIIIRPTRTLKQISLEDKPVWLLPLLLLTVLAVISTFVAGPLRQQAAQNAGIELPPSFEYMTPEQQEQYMQAQQNMNGPATTVLFPAVGSLAGIWLSWFLLGSILHLVLTLFGSRSTNTTAYNLAAWSGLPFAIRMLVQIIAMLTTRQLITSPGLSGFVAADSGQILLYVQVLLRLVDIYLIWQIILLSVGAAATSGLSRGKAFLGALLSVLLLALLSALPGFISEQFGALQVTQPFIFF